MEGQCLHKRRRKLPDGARAGPKEGNGIVMPRPNQVLGLFHCGPQDGFRHPSQTLRPHCSIGDLGIQEHLPELLEQAELFIGRAGDRFAACQQCLFGGTMIVPQTLVVQCDGDIGVMVECLMEKGQQERIPPGGRHPRQVLVGGTPPQSGQPLHPVGIEPGAVPGLDTALE
jgi:hypothetical protein